MEQTFGSVRCNGVYCPVTRLTDLDGDPTDDLYLAEWLTFQMPDGELFTIENAPGILIPIQ